MVICPTIPACPPIWTLLPTFGTAAHACLCCYYGIIAHFHIIATWIRLSSLAPLRISVLPMVALSIEQLEPISTLSSMTTFPICGTFYSCHRSVGKSQIHRLQWWFLHGWLRYFQSHNRDIFSHRDGSLHYSPKPRWHQGIPADKFLRYCPLSRDQKCRWRIPQNTCSPKLALEIT